MANVLVQDTSLTAIANAIREKNGLTDTYKPAEMATAIQALSSGGGGKLKYLKIQFYNKYLEPFTNKNLPKDGTIGSIVWGRTYSQFSKANKSGVNIAIHTPRNGSVYSQDTDVFEYDESNGVDSGQYDYSTQTFTCNNQYTTDGYVILFWVE